MKPLFYLLSLTLFLSFSTDLCAQLTSSALTATTTANPSQPVSDTQAVPIAKEDPELSKRERQRFQRSLVRRGDELAQWDQELENRELKLNGRGARGRRALSRNPLPARLLKSEGLYAWETRLDRLAERLRTKDLLLQEREIRLLRNSRLRDHDSRNGHHNSHSSTNNSGRCVEATCNSGQN